MTARPALSHARVIEAAVRVADRGGLASVSMRNVGRELGVEAMSLYHHVEGKEALLDALADWAFARIELPMLDEPWRSAMQRRTTSAREVLGSHPWTLGLIESRRVPGEHLLRHHDRMLGCLRRNGFPVALATHAFSLLDAYVYGFVLSERHLPLAPDETLAEFAVEIAPHVPAERYPYLAETVAAHVDAGFVYGDEFMFGLELILDSLEARLAASDGSAVEW